MKDVFEYVNLFGKWLFLSPVWFVIQWCDSCPHLCVGVSRAVLASLTEEFMTALSSYVDTVFLLKVVISERMLLTDW